MSEYLIFKSFQENEHSFFQITHFTKFCPINREYNLNDSITWEDMHKFLKLYSFISCWIICVELHVVFPFCFLPLVLSYLMYWHFACMQHVNNMYLIYICLFVCLFVCLGVFVPLENFSLIRRSHHCKFWSMLGTYGHWAVKVL